MNARSSERSVEQFARHRPAVARNHHEHRVELATLRLVDGESVGEFKRRVVLRKIPPRKPKSDIGPTSERDSVVHSAAQRGFNVAHGVRDGMAYWAVSDLNRDELSAMLTAQLSEP